MERIFLYPVGFDLPAALSGTGRFKNRKKKLVGLYHSGQKGFGGALNLPAYYYIMSKIVRAPIFEKGYKDFERPYVSISSSLIAAITGNPDFLTDLLHAGIIERGGAYKVGANCYGYRLAEKYLDLEFKIYKGKHNLKFDEVEKLENLSEGYRYTLKSMELFQLNFKLANKMLSTLKEEVRENQSLLLKIMKHESETKMFDYTIGPHSGRLYTSVTSQKRTFRRLWNLSNEPVAIVDVGSCQPALLYSLYKEHGRAGCPEEAYYREKIENGSFYKIFVDDSEIDFSGSLSRDEVKPLLYKTWFGNSDWKANKDATTVRNCFIRYFPVMYSILNKIKKDNHKLAARLLQSMESTAIFDSIIPEIKKAGVPCLTIHDALVVPKSCSEIAQSILRKEFSDIVEINVKVSISIPSEQN